MKKTMIYLSISLVLLLGACKSGSTSSQNNNKNSQQDTIKAIKQPVIPQMITIPEQQAEFLVTHYWDNVNFADTNYIHHPDITEQAWVDYCDMMKHVPLSTAQQAIRTMFDQASIDKKVFNYFTELADRYFYDPNSPMRNEEYYIPVLEAMMNSPILDETDKIRPEARLKLAHKNRMGTKALNFTYTLASGVQSSLYQLRADYTLLFINNPGCHACSETIEGLKNSANISQLLQSKRLIILSIYPDEELDEWKKYQNSFPKEWINAYDKQLTIKEEQRYDLKAIPTLYLLNKDKIVLLKDATTQAIEQMISKSIK